MADPAADPLAAGAASESLVAPRARRALASAWFRLPLQRVDLTTDDEQRAWVSSVADAPANARAEVAVDGLSGIVEDAVEKRLALLRPADRDTHRLGG